MLFDSLEGVIGVDTHRDTLAAVAVTAVGATLGHADAPASAEGYQQLPDFARAQVPGRRCWAVEGTSSYGAGLTAFLSRPGNPPQRPPDRTAQPRPTRSTTRPAEHASRRGLRPHRC